MPSFLNFDFYDSNNIHGKMRVPITTQTLPTGVATYAGAILTAAVGTGLIALPGLAGVSLEITDVVAPAALAGDCDIRNKWQATMLDADGNLQRFAIPGRDVATDLVVNGSKILGDLTLPQFSTVLSALLGSGAIHMENGKTGSLITGWGPVLATTRSRKRPRVGGSR